MKRARVTAISPYVFSVTAARPRPKRQSRTDRFYAEVAASTVADRQPAGEVEIEVHNPSNKLVSYWGAPVRRTNYTLFDGEVKCHRCTFRLPADWCVVDEPGQFPGGGLSPGSSGPIGTP